MSSTQTMDPWSLFVDERPRVAVALARVEPQPREAPVARIELEATDEERASYLVAGAVFAAVVVLIAGLAAGGVDSAATAGGWTLAVVCAAAAAVRAAWSHVTRRPAEYALGNRGIAQHMRRPGRPDEVTLIPWDELTFYRDSESTDHASLLAVSANGVRIRLHQPDAPESTYQFIREFVAYAEHRSPLRERATLQSIANRLGVVGTGLILIVTWIALEQLSPEAQVVGTIIAALLVFLGHSFVVLTDDDRAYEDRRSDALDARVRDGARRLLGIQPA